MSLRCDLEVPVDLSRPEDSGCNVWFPLNAHLYRIHLQSATSCYIHTRLSYPQFLTRANLTPWNQVFTCRFAGKPSPPRSALLAASQEVAVEAQGYGRRKKTRDVQSLEFRTTDMQKWKRMAWHTLWHGSKLSGIVMEADGMASWMTIFRIPNWLTLHPWCFQGSVWRFYQSWLVGVFWSRKGDT